MPPPPHVATGDVLSTIPDLRQASRAESGVPGGAVSWSQLTVDVTTGRTRLNQAMQRVLAESLKSAASETGGVSRFNSGP
jgi:hypothetical protein